MKKIWKYLFVLLVFTACSQPNTSTPTLPVTFTPVPSVAATPHPTPYALAGTCGNTPLVPRLAQFVENGQYQLTTSSQDGMLSDTVRSLKLIEDALWVGYGSTDLPINLSVLTATSWETCEKVNGHVNMIDVHDWGPNPTNDKWIITDGRGFFRFHNGGLYHYHGGFEPMWYGNSPVDSRGYDVDFDSQGDAFVSTYEGVFCFNVVKEDWYDCDLTESRSDHVHAFVLLGSAGVAYATINNGGVYQNPLGMWNYFTIHDDPEHISTNAMRVVELYEGKLCYGGDPGFWGCYDLDSREWQVEELPAPLNTGAVLDVEWQSDGTMWLATTTGTGYLKSGEWTVFSRVPALTLELCEECFLGSNLVVIGTDGSGIIVAEISK